MGVASKGEAVSWMGGIAHPMVFFLFQPAHLFLLLCLKFNDQLELSRLIAVAICAGSKGCWSLLCFFLASFLAFRIVLSEWGALSVLSLSLAALGGAAWCLLLCASAEGCLWRWPRGAFGL